MSGTDSNHGIGSTPGNGAGSGSGRPGAGMVVDIDGQGAVSRFARPRTAEDLPNRRKLYKRLDSILKRVKLRYVPAECSDQVLCESAPAPAEDGNSGVAPQNWSQIYSRAGTRQT